MNIFNILLFLQYKLHHKCLTGLHIGLWKHWSFQNEANMKSSHQRCSVKKGVLRNFAKFTGKHLCQSLVFNKVAGGACKRCYKRFLLNFIKKHDKGNKFTALKLSGTTQYFSWNTAANATNIIRWNTAFVILKNLTIFSFSNQKKTEVL